MSRLDELIKELCPNGVEYKELKDLCIISRGKVISKDYIRDNPGDFPVYSSQTENEGNLGNISTYDYDGEYLTWTTDGANAGTVFYRNTKFNVTNVCGLLKVKVEEMISKFLYYFLVIKAPEYVNRGMGNPKLMSNVMEKIKVPIPPLEVQNEIARILDDYTKSVEELKEKLNTELITRKKQYSWYRDYLLKFENKVKIVKLGELFEFKNGINKEKSSFGKGTPIINYVNIYKKNKIYFEDLQGLVEATDDELIRYKVKRGDVFFTRTSETIEEIGFTSVLLEDIENCVFSGFLLRARPLTDLLLPEYCAYCFSTSSMRNAIIRKSTYTTRALINGTSLSQIEIPLPPLEVQKRIVEVLDNFEKTCKELNIELSSEIEKKQKEYEFYRNYLLTFEEKSRQAILACELASLRSKQQAQNLIKILQYVYGYVELELDKVANITMGVSPSGNSITNIKSEKNIEFHQGKTYFGETMLLQSNVYTNEPKKYVENNSIVMSVRAPVGDTNMVDRKISIGRGLCSILADEKISLTKYLYYYIKSNVDKLKAMSNGSTFEAINSESIRKFTVSLPPLEEQQRIVDILDRFDRLCNDISEGLPAEIEARQKQYEYYREKLLNFKKL
jgi:putative type I restriction-modification system